MKELVWHRRDDRVYLFGEHVEDVSRLLEISSAKLRCGKSFCSFPFKESRENIALLKGAEYRNVYVDEVERTWAHVNRKSNGEIASKEGLRNERDG